MSSSEAIQSRRATSRWPSDGEPGVRARRAASAYLDFVIGDANLPQVMFRHEEGRDAEAIGRSASAAFAPLQDLFPGDHEGRAATVFLATLQGIAGLVNCGVVPTQDVPDLSEEVVARFFTSHTTGDHA